MTTWTTVSTATELTEAISAGELHIEVSSTLSGMPSIALPPGGSIRGGRLRFGGRGVRVTSDNTLSDIAIETADTEVAIAADTDVESLGTLTLENVTTIGQIALVAEGRLRSGHVVAKKVTVERADVRGRSHRPHNYGVDALQGGFLLWNRQSGASRITATLENLSAGSPEASVRGSGIMVGGAADSGGEGVVEVDRLSTGDVYTDGGIAPGTPDVISGAVFVVGGATIERVDDLGPVTTFGQNDMVLDNWGTVREWHAHAQVTSHGPSGIGFVNFGALGTLRADAAIRTFGVGSRGFNLYDGSLEEAHFESISTAGDGAIGVQISQPLTRLTVTGDITTRGGTGTSLVKGVQVTLQAMALSVKEGGSIGRLDVGGELASQGAGLATAELLGPIGEANVAGGIRASGHGSVAVRADTLPPSFGGIDLHPPFSAPSAGHPAGAPEDGSR